MTETPDPIDVQVGVRPRLQRKLIGISQTELAQALGIAFQQIQKYERGVNRISASRLVRTAAILKTMVASLVGERFIELDHPDLFRHLKRPNAIELLAAFSMIPDSASRRALVQLAEAMARERRP